MLQECLRSDQVSHAVHRDSAFHSVNKVLQKTSMIHNEYDKAVDLLDTSMNKNNIRKKNS
jgi:hypothetical protein